MIAKNFTYIDEIRALRCVLCFSALAAWCWLMLKSYGDPLPFVFNDEFGPLFGVFPSAILFLYILGIPQKGFCCGERRRIAESGGCLALCSPVLMGFFASPEAVPGLEIGVNVLAGFGLATALTALTAEISSLPAREILAATSFSILASAAVIEAILLLRPETLLLMPVVLALVFHLLLPAMEPRAGPASALSGKETGQRAPGKPFFLYLLTGFSFGLYYSLMAVMEPLLPRPHSALLGMVATGCAACGGCIYLARRTAIFRIILLMAPILVVGYTAWPLIHRESPALSLGSLHLAYILLAILTLTSVFLACARLKRFRPEAVASLIGTGNACLLAGTLLGACAIPAIRSSFSRGTNINYIFAVISVTILVSSWSYVYLLGKLRFWNAAAESQSPGRPESESPSFSIWNQMESGSGKPKLEPADYEYIFREMGLTRQQAVIAALLATRHKDADICQSLNISPNTLKTHIRNILRKLDIKSRHELGWLAETRSGTTATFK